MKNESVVLSDEDKRQIKAEGESRRRGHLPKDDFTMSSTEIRNQSARVGSEKSMRDDALVEGRTANLDDVGPQGLDGGRCPHCGEDTSVEGVMSAAEITAMDDSESPDREHTCGSCGGEWGPRASVPARRSKPSGSGIKIEKHRDESNGVKRPSSGGKCRAVWDGLDAEGLDTTAKRARELAASEGWDKTTTMVQFYRWRKFNGITGRHA